MSVDGFAGIYVLLVALNYFCRKLVTCLSNSSGSVSKGSFVWKNADMFPVINIYTYIM